MIERVLIKDCLTFEKAELEFGEGLIAFTGESGAGKSVLINALLTLFGLNDMDARLLESSIGISLPELHVKGIEEEELNVVKFLKEKKARYFINSQAISKKNVYEIFSKYIRYLSVRDDNEFSSFSMIDMLDKLISKDDKNHLINKKSYEELYRQFLHVKTELDYIKDEEKKIDELREFAKYEVKTIDEIDPKIGEDEELLEFKRSLSKKEKISQAIEDATGIFEYESAVNELFNLCEIDSSFFDECMNDVRAYIDESRLKLDELEDVDIESLLLRLEQLSKLKSRFGSISESLEYREKKLEELKRYENISYEKGELESKYKNLQKNVNELANNLSSKRKKEVKKLENIVNSYLQKLYLKNAQINLHVKDLNIQGIDEVEVKLNDVDLKKISSGELNRIRLAFIATKNELFCKNEGGVLILDEVDANLSGKEAMSVANVLKEISKNYQVIAISHQPQLSSRANQHFLVEKNDGKSNVKLLSNKERVQELARMVSGEIVQDEAVEFAKKLLEQVEVG